MASYDLGLNYTPEHSGAGDETPTAQSDQTPEEKKLVKTIMSMFGRYKAARKPYDEKWLDYYRMFRGRQWFETRPTYRHSEVINLIFQHIQSVAPLQLDARPRISFVATEPSDQEFAQILDQVCEFDWEKNNWMLELAEVIYDGYIYGTGISTMEYDDDADYGIGRICFKSMDPLYTYPDPSSRDVNKETRGFIYAEPMDIDVAKRKWPKSKDFIKADVFDVNRSSKTDLQQVKYKSPTDTKVILEGESTSSLADKNEALIITCYWYPDEIEEEEKKKDPSESDPQGGVEFIQRLRFPKGRKTIVCGNHILEDGPIPYEDGKIPFSKYINYALPREFWGISEVEQLASPQKTFNKLVSFSLDVLTLMGNPVWVVSSDSGVDVDNLYNRPGLIVEKEPGSEVRREEGVQLQPYVLQLIDRMKGWFDQIGGSQDVTRGVNPTGVTAASAIESLMDAAQTRIRQKMRNLDAFLRDAGQQYVSRALQFYTFPKMYRITNDQNSEKYFKFHVEDVDDEETGEKKKMAIVRPYLKDQEGVWQPSDEMKFILRGDLDVRANTGSSLPFSKAERDQKYLNLFDRGIIDAEEVLKGIEFPGAEAILQRMATKAQEAQASAPAQ